MKLLLDTCTFLWWTEDSPRLSKGVRSAVSDPTHEVHVSTVSIWEIAVKYHSGRLPFQGRPSGFCRSSGSATAS